MAQILQIPCYHSCPPPPGPHKLVLVNGLQNLPFFVLRLNPFCAPGYFMVLSAVVCLPSCINYPARPPRKKPDQDIFFTKKFADCQEKTKKLAAPVPASSLLSSLRATHSHTPTTTNDNTFLVQTPLHNYPPFPSSRQQTHTRSHIPDAYS